MADHIQLHQGWMRNFKNDIRDGEQVYCFNVGNCDICDGKNIIESGKIGSIKIKSLGAIDNYYIRDFEHYLDKNWETKFGDIYKIMSSEFKNKKQKINLTPEQILFIKRFMALNLGRSLFLQREFTKTVRYSYELIGMREILPASIAIENLQLFKNKNIQFLKNTTSVGFVLPSISYYYVTTQYERMPIIPLSDKWAIRFIKRYNNQLDINAQGLVLDINDEENIKNYNYYAMLTERYTNGQFIISKQKKELECLLHGE